MPTTSGNNATQDVGDSSAHNTVTSSMMHDFNLSMSEYRSEIREDIAQLDSKINRLETILLQLVDDQKQRRPMARKWTTINVLQQDNSSFNIVNIAFGSPVLFTRTILGK